MKRLAALAFCTVAFGVACSRTTSAPAATVNGTAVSTHDLVEELNAIQANQDFIDSLQTGAAGASGTPSGGGITVVGSTPGSFDAAFVAQVLLRQIDYSMIHSEVVKRHVVIDDACRVQARNDALLNLGQQNADAGEQLLKKFPQRYQDVLIQRNADVIALEGALSGQQCGKGVDAAGYYDTHPDDFTKLCLSVIAVTDQATADAVVAQARGGADFATLARQVSTDTETKDLGGDIGCRLPSAFNPTVSSLLQAGKTGEVLDPIPGQGGISVVKITDRQLAPLDEVRTQAEELATANAGQSFGTWLRQARADAKVTIDSRYGTFDPANFVINPPTLELNSSSPSSPSS
ncbi:MAG: foldase protein PrsA, partial [Actinomycetota bacterium]|nr:foldase protein PrsA [Actinomycetota bacterium]